MTIQADRAGEVPPWTDGRPSDRRTLRVSFVMEQHVGHRTFYENLRRPIAEHRLVDASWVEVSYAPSTAAWERLPRLGERLRGALRGRREVREGVQRRHADVHFFFTQVPAVIGGRAARSVPYVLCSDITPLQYDRMAEGYGHVPDGHGLGGRLKHAVNRHTFQRAARIVAFSDWARTSFVDDYGVDPERVVVIGPGVDTQRWAPRGDRHAGPMRILFVGADFERKGGERLLRAFRALPPGVAELVVVTRTPLAEEPGVRVELGMAANTPELIALFRCSDVFVLPSSAEAFGHAAIEAAATGLPIIASRVGGLAETVVDGVTGFVIDPSDVEGLTRYLLCLAQDADLRVRMGRAARRRVEEQFCAKRNAERIVDVLYAATGGHR